MKTIWNHENRETRVEINGQGITLAAGGCRSGLDGMSYNEILKAAKKEGLDWRDTEVVLVRAEGVEEVARAAVASKLAQHGLIRVDLLTETDLSALSRETLLRINDETKAGAVAPDATKKQLVANILAVSSSGRTPGQSPGDSGSTPDAASNPSASEESTLPAGGTQAVITDSEVDAAEKEVTD